MGSYKEIKGDLLELFAKGEFEVIAHGCNCFETMGAGIALQISTKFPEVYETDINYKVGSGHKIEKLGNINYTLVARKNGFYGSIVNMYTQYRPGPNADLTAIRLCLKKINHASKNRKPISIGLPLVGSGIGGLDWETQVKSIVQEELKDMDVTVVHYDKRIN